MISIDISDESIMLFIYIMVAIGLLGYAIVQWELSRMIRKRKERELSEETIKQLPSNYQRWIKEQKEREQ